MLSVDREPSPSLLGRTPSAVLAVVLALLASALSWRFLLAGTSMIAELVGVPTEAMRTPGVLPALMVLVGVVVGVNAFLLARGRAPRAFVRAEVIVYLALALYLVLFKAPGDRGLQLDPTTAGDHMSGELVFNVVLLIPFGALAYRWWGRLGVVLGIAAVLVVAVEALQYAFALGISDIVDVITNLAGVGIGFGVVAALARLGWAVRLDGRTYVVEHRKHTATVSPVRS